MTAYCSKCDVQLRTDSSHSMAKCPDCKKEWDTSKNYVMYGSSEPGEWEDYTGTFHIIAVRLKEYTK